MRFFTLATLCFAASALRIDQQRPDMACVAHYVNILQETTAGDNKDTRYTKEQVSAELTKLGASAEEQQEISKAAEKYFPEQWKANSFG